MIYVTTFILLTSSLFFVVCDGPKIVFGFSNFNSNKFYSVIFSIVFLLLIMPTTKTIYRTIKQNELENKLELELKQKKIAKYKAFIKAKEIEESEEVNRLEKEKILFKEQNSSYIEGNDGKIYESTVCTLCKGTGIEENRSSFSDEVGRVCPMCDGKGVRSY
jgi:hypothetical protein